LQQKAYTVWFEHKRPKQLVMDSFIRAVKDAYARFDTTTDIGIPALPHVSKSDAEFLATTTLAIEALLRSL
jgi:hypothetical protein